MMGISQNGHWVTWHEASKPSPPQTNTDTHRQSSACLRISLCHVARRLHRGSTPLWNHLQCIKTQSACALNDCAIQDTGGSPDATSGWLLEAPNTKWPVVPCDRVSFSVSGWHRCISGGWSMWLLLPTYKLLQFPTPMPYKYKSNSI